MKDADVEVGEASETRSQRSRMKIKTGVQIDRLRFTVIPPTIGDCLVDESLRIIA
jgi:hypothetical protein